MAVLSALLVILLGPGLSYFVDGTPHNQWRGSRSEGTPLSWGSALAKADSFVARLNLTEKISMTTGFLIRDGAIGSCDGNILGIPRLNFSGFCLQDGPTSVRPGDLVSVFPAGLTAAASWDKGLIYERYLLLGNEFRSKGINIALGPVAGPLGRHPLGGRNWEGFSPDPYLTGVAVGLSVQGMNKAGVQSCSKHFIGNEQETQRSNSPDPITGFDIEGISSNIDDRTLHELYLWPFVNAVKAGTAALMCSYNRLNQTYSCENDELLNGILKEELGFQGFVMSDWFATHTGVKSVNAGLDMTMPGPTNVSTVPTDESFFGKALVDAVNNGSVTISRLDDMVRRIMLPYYALGQDIDYPTVDPTALLVESVTYGLGDLPNLPARDVRADHATFIRKLGAAGTVLLKNVNSALPLKLPTNIGVFGNDAPAPETLSWLDTTTFEIGTLDVGGGSGSGRHSSLVSPLDAIKAKAQSIGARFQWITSNNVLAAGDFRTIYPTPDVCLVFLKTFASEAYDRASFELDWNSTLVVNNVARRCPNTIVITHSSGVNTFPWASNPNITAILAAHYPGEQTGNSIVDILWGDVNPSGKLPYTIPVDELDYDFPIVNITNVTTPGAWQSDFTEGLLIDYRHFDSKNIIPLYEFGFGLSYTTFGLADFSVTTLVKNLASTPDISRRIAPGGNPDLFTPIIQASVAVSNTGSLAGATVAQLYISMPDSAPSGTPVKVLRGFEKVYLEPGETKAVDFELMRRDVSYWDVLEQTWKIPKGDFKFAVGFSSRDLKATRVEALL